MFIKIDKKKKKITVNGCPRINDYIVKEGIVQEYEIYYSYLLTAKEEYRNIKKT